MVYFKLAIRQIYLSLNFHLHLKSEVLFAPEECRKVWVFTVTTTTKMRLNFKLFFSFPRQGLTNKCFILFEEVDFFC